MGKSRWIATGSACVFLLLGFVPVLARADSTDPIPPDALPSPMSTTLEPASPMPIDTPSAAPTTLVTATPTAPPVVMPSVFSTPVHRTRYPVIQEHIPDPNLSGEITYTFDQVAQRGDLSELGVKAMPVHYHPMVEFRASGLQIFVINKEHAAVGTNLALLTMQDPAQFLAKLRGFMNAHLLSQLAQFVPLTAKPAPSAHCRAEGSYRVGNVTVHALACSANTAEAMHLEVAVLTAGRTPVTLVGRSGDEKIDRAAFKQLIHELSAAKAR